MYNFTSDLGLSSYEDVFKNAYGGKSSLILVSGGLDSAYLLWKYSQYSDDIKCHHVSLLTRGYSPRQQSEKIAVNRQIEYLRQKGKNVKLLTSTIDIDYDVVGIRDLYSVILSSMHYALYEKCRHIVVGDDLVDAYYRGQSYSRIDEKLAKEVKLVNEFVKTYTYGRCDISMAINGSNLSEVYYEMPEDYRKLIFSCRTPVHINNENSIRMFEACGKCSSCMKNIHFGWWDRIGKAIHKEDTNGTSI